MPALIELSHTITSGMVTYPGLPEPEITDFLTREETAARMAPGVSFHIGRICMVANTGTYLDVPFHFFADGDDLSCVGINRLAGLPGIIVDHRDGRALDTGALAGVEIAGRAVLIRTGWTRHFGTEAYGVGAPFIPASVVDVLVRGGAALVGIDSLNIDDIEDLTRPAHVGLLGAGIPIVEHLANLDALPSSGFTFTATPPRVEGMGTFPVRAFAEISSSD